MSKLFLTKLEAARRQIEAAIHMTFAGEDPTAIHSVAAAAREIVKSLCELSGNIESYMRFTDWIAPGYEKVFWTAANHSANFLKHADLDPNSTHELDEEETDFVIVLAARWYRELSGETNKVLGAFMIWFTIRHPNVMGVAAKTALQNAGYLKIMEEIIRLGTNLSREQHLLLGQEMLNGLATEDNA
jgi:hypothetical protein